MNETLISQSSDVIDMPELLPEMNTLIRRVRKVMADMDGRVLKTISADQLEKTFRFRPEGGGETEIILAADTAVELGHPSTASLSIVLVTGNEGVVRDGAVTLAGPDITEMKQGARQPFAQVVMVEAAKEAAPDPFELDSVQYLTNRLSGYMVRSVPGRLWARVGRAAYDAGISLSEVGSALIHTYGKKFEGVSAVEVAFITSTRDEVETLAQVKTEADILAGRHKKLVLGMDGEVECSELNCEACDEKPVCDNLRDVVIKRRKLKNG